MNKYRDDIIPLAIGLAALLALAFAVGGCGTLHVAYGPDGEPSSLSLKLADAAPTPEQAKTPSESVADTVQEIDEAGAAILNSSLVQAGIGILTGGTLLGGVGAWAGHRGRKVEADKQNAVRNEHNATWDEAQLDLIRKLQMQSTAPVLTAQAGRSFIDGMPSQ